MKLINFNSSESLKSLLKEMGATYLEGMNRTSWKELDESKLKVLLDQGEVEIDFEQIDFLNGYFEYKGRRVIVYIRDQYYKYYEKGYKFHLSKCLTISNSIENNRNSRYVISLRTDGKFKINLVDGDTKVEEGKIEELKVCKNCLTALNYKGYKNQTYTRKSQIFEDFDLHDFFKSNPNSSFNTNLFKSERDAPLNEYSQDFDHISSDLRSTSNHTCSECGLNLSASKYKNEGFLHVHHRNAVKTDNRPQNLQVLCIRCHANKPMHSWLKSSPEYARFMEIFEPGLF